MGLRHWIKSKMGEDGADLPPNASLWEAMRGRDDAPVHALGEYDADSYPVSLAQQLARRQQVSEALMRLDLLTAPGRVEAIPRLKELLVAYPHPLAYEALINAFADAGKWDEAKGVAFAARERRWDCERSPFPEIRGETTFLREWTPEEVDALRAERERSGAPVLVLTRDPAPLEAATVTA